MGFKINSPTADVQSNAVRIGYILAGSAFVLVVACVSFYLFSLHAWQLLVGAGLVGLFAGLCLFGTVLIRRGRLSAGVWLMIGSLYVLFPAMSALFAGFSVILAINLILITALVATLTLSSQHSYWALMGGLFAAVMTVLLDSPRFSYRLSIPYLQNFMTIIAILSLVILGLLILRRFRDFPLRNKLVLSFLLVSLVSVGTVSFINSQAMANVLAAEAGTNLENLARAQALGLGNVLSREIAILRGLSLSQNLRDRLLVANARYDSYSTAELEDRMQELDQLWRENPNGPLPRARLNSPVARELRALRASFPNHLQLLVTDKYGGVIGVTGSNTDFYQADKDWWQIVSGRGDTFLDLLVTREGMQNPSITMALPIYDASGAIIGVLHSIFDFSEISELIATPVTDQPSISTDLLLFDNWALSVDRNELVSYSDETMTNLELLMTQTFGDILFEETPHLVSQTPVVSAKNEPAVNNLGWRVIARQELEQALAPVQSQTRRTMLVALIIATVVIGAAVIMAQVISGPILRLTEVAQQIAAGDMLSQAAVSSDDEVGSLARAFNVMADRLRSTIGTLEDRVAERTNQLETVVAVNRRLSGILDISQLLQEVVVLTKETFGFYHVHIYLLDEVRKTLMMAEGYGEAGIEMKRQGHNIPVATTHSLVARAAREGRIITTENVRSDPYWLPNPLLPETQSEMAVPVMLDNVVVGVLDVQSNQVAGLKSNDETLLQSLAQQIAIAVRNARLFDETQMALLRAERVQSLYTGAAWEQFSVGHQLQHFEVREENLPELTQINTPEATAALQQERTIRLHINGNDADTELSVGADTLATPLKLRNQVIGVLGIRDEKNTNRHWTEDEIALIEAVTEQMSLAIENARLFEETGRRAGREKIIAEITQQMWASGDLERVMETAIQQLSQKLNASKVVIKLGTPGQFAQPTGSDDD